MLPILIPFVALVVAGTVGLFLLTQTIGAVMGARTLRELRVTEMICNENKVPGSWLGTIPIDAPVARKRLIRKLRRHEARQQHNPALQNIVVREEIQQHMRTMKDRLDTEDLLLLVGEDPALRHTSAVVDGTLLTTRGHVRLLQRIMHDGYRLILYGDPTVTIPTWTAKNVHHWVHPLTEQGWKSVVAVLAVRDMSREAVVIATPVIPPVLGNKLGDGLYHCESPGDLEAMLHTIEKQFSEQ